MKSETPITDELTQWRNVADELAAALNQLNIIYRSEYDEPGDAPPWFNNALIKYNRLKEQAVAAMPNA